jgi:hypothetical protein
MMATMLMSTSTNDLLELVFIEFLNHHVCEYMIPPLLLIGCLGCCVALCAG